MQNNKTGIIIALFIGLVLGLVIGNFIPRFSTDQGAGALTPISTVSPVEQIACPDAGHVTYFGPSTLSGVSCAIVDGTTCTSRKGYVECYPGPQNSQACRCELAGAVQPSSSTLTQ